MYDQQLSATGGSRQVSIWSSMPEQFRFSPMSDCLRYLRFLSSGSSDYSINLLRDAGVDLSTPQPIQQALDTFSAFLDDFEQLL